MRTDEGEKLLAFVLSKGHRGCCRTRHGRLPETDGMRAEDGGMLPQPGSRLKSNFFLPRCTSVTAQNSVQGRSPRRYTPGGSDSRPEAGRPASANLGRV